MSAKKTTETSTEFVSVRGESSGVTYIRAAELADKKVEGIYLGVVTGQFGPNYKFSTDSGDVIVNGSGALNSQMQKVSEGEKIRLEYRGQKKITEGPMKGKAFHDIDVQRAKA